jgi:hypothetical protein
MTDITQDLMDAVTQAKASEYAGVGLSAQRDKSGNWRVALAVDHSMTIISSDEVDYRELSPRAIAREIAECWDADWDES